MVAALLLLSVGAAEATAQAEVGAPTLEAVVAADLQGATTAVVAGVVTQGELDFLQAWGTLSSESATSVEVQTPMAFPALTEILLAMTVRAFGAAGALDPEAPLSVILPERTGLLGRVTLNQLLSHTSGLDNAALAPGLGWDDALAGLDDGAFIAEPGTIFSLSRYSFPLAAHVLERVVGMSFADIATAAVLTPLGMTGSTFDVATAASRGLAVGYEFGPAGPTRVAPAPVVDGMPVLYTTAPDVLQLLSAWMTEGIRGSSPLGSAPPDVPRLDVARHFGDGVMQDVAALTPQAWVNRVGAGFGTAIHLYPEQETALFIWSNGDVARGTLNWIRQLVAEAVGDVETTMASQGVRVTRTLDAELQPDGLDDLSEWAGLYRNGSARIGLRLTNGQLFYYDGRQDLPLLGVGPATFAASNGPPLELLRLGDRRMLLYGNLAYVWESAEVPPAGG
jgi:CubicO group peptidase (beta-lactamase class C family)